MSVAALHYHKFADQVAREQRVFTFTRDDELLVYPVRGNQVVPFWSSQSRMETVLERFPKYRAFTVTEMSLGEFYDWLKQLEEEGILVGVNWSGRRLAGYDSTVADVRLIDSRLHPEAKQQGRSGC